MNNFKIGLTNDNPATAKPLTGRYQLCYQHPGNVADNAVITVTCKEDLDPARYLFVTTNQEYLTICELYAYGDIELPNIALGKKAIQSSTYAGEVEADAELAVDGNSDSNAFHNHCSLTGVSDLNPWWAVDLAARYSVTEVKLVLRDSYGQFMNNFKIGLTNDNPATTSPLTGRYQLCYQHPGTVADNAFITVTCKEDLDPARYLFVATNQEYLTICELYAYGHIVDNTQCRTTVMGLEYTGTISVTSTGKTCQQWTQQSPHTHSMTDPAKFPDESIEAASNYCRNPDFYADGPWCYTTDPGTRWELCNVPLCPVALLQENYR
jgi:hypothetical protein